MSRVCKHCGLIMESPRYNRLYCNALCKRGREYVIRRMRRQTDVVWRDRQREVQRVLWLAMTPEIRKKLRRAKYIKERAKQQLADVSPYVNIYPSEISEYRRVGALN